MLAPEHAKLLYSRLTRELRALAARVRPLFSERWHWARLQIDGLEPAALGAPSPDAFESPIEAMTSGLLNWITGGGIVGMVGKVGVIGGMPLWQRTGAAARTARIRFLTVYWDMGVRSFRNRFGEQLLLFSNRSCRERPRQRWRNCKSIVKRRNTQTRDCLRDIPRQTLALRPSTFARRYPQDRHPRGNRVTERYRRAACPG